jgi:hypothetical protein
MPERVTNNRLREFVVQLEEAGGSSSNGRLRERLGWEEEFYWRAQGKLIEQGQIVPGRGRGGTVRLSAAEGEPEPDDCEDASIANKRASERPLYQPIKETIESTWIRRFGFDDVRVEETHSRGKKNTGGTFTRPDITVVGVRRYVFLSKRLEVVSFEIKTEDTIGIIGVLEAVAHREAAHRAYVIYATSRAKFEVAAEAERIIELAQKYGVGIVLSEKPADVGSWEILIDALRHEPDPARLDRFLGDLPNESLKKQIHKWLD